MTVMTIQCWVSVPSHHVPHRPSLHVSLSQTPHKVSETCSPQSSTRRTVSLSAISTIFSVLVSSNNTCRSNPTNSEFFELQGSGGVKALELRTGTGDFPVDGDQVAIHYYGRLAAKQGWRFDSTYDHKDETGEPIPFVFILGSGKVISGIEATVRSMKVGGVRRVIIPPSQGYQNTSQEPIPPNHFRLLEVASIRDKRREIEPNDLVMCNKNP